VSFNSFGRERRVTSGNIGSRARMREMLDFSARHGVVAQTEAMPFDQVNAALERVRRNEARYRVVLTA
jgi:D-arabinose 1-dehydrogenase-like Zn-dependent alcohol dehydrogenase